MWLLTDDSWQIIWLLMTDDRWQRSDNRWLIRGDRWQITDDWKMIKDGRWQMTDNWWVMTDYWWQMKYGWWEMEGDMKTDEAMTNERFLMTDDSWNTQMTQWQIPRGLLLQQWVQWSMLPDKSEIKQNMFLYLFYLLIFCFPARQLSDLVQTNKLHNRGKQAWAE